jgi:hypothetical protein
MHTISHIPDASQFANPGLSSLASGNDCAWFY